MITLQHVTKLYRTVIGVNDLNIELKEGAFGLIGPNGSGKTTLINLLTGNLQPTIGEVRIDGKDPWRNRRVLGQLGLCPATDILLPSVSALDWVTFLLGLGGFSRADAKQRALASLTRVGMEQAMQRPIGSYSLGMRQRTKLAQAIAHDPQWLILDEPFNGLDPVGRQELAELVRDWGGQGRGLLLASHVLHEVESVTSRFLLIHGGRVLASGSAGEVQEMLVDFPKEVKLHGRQLQVLAADLVALPAVNSVHVSLDRTEMTVGVRDPKSFFDILRKLVVDRSAEVTEIASLDGNLTVAFDTLLRAHRGELE